MLTLRQLDESRKLLQEFCRAHVPSLTFYRCGLSFLLTPDEAKFPKDAIEHISSTATCWSSYLACPPGLRESAPNLMEDIKRFADVVIATACDENFANDRWKSDGSARIYCRCRALPFVIKNLSKYHSNVEKHVGIIFVQLDKELVREAGKVTNKLQRRTKPQFGIGEAGPTAKDSWYPPNAFHTYWTLSLLNEIRSRFPEQYEELQKKFELERRRAEMIVWSRRMLGHQIALHSATPQSSVLDTDQLGWALASVITFDSNLESNLAEQDLLKQALKCLFSTQTDVGTWRHYAPLFNYLNVGNAYCYVFETFAHLLIAALSAKPEAEFVRTILFPYAEELLCLWRYAKSTQIQIGSGDQCAAWCSGHRIGDRSPESWATASVFAYSQALRRLIGIWTREQARLLLDRPRITTPDKALQDLLQRGETWRENSRSVADKILTMFVNPVLMHSSDGELDADDQPIEEDQPRSAILYGPPGTGKTFLARAIAGAVGWEYVELHASHFVSDGLPNVQKRADEIFQRLMQLDHAVVLFDEVDELVRSREAGGETDAFGRFLTTSMLPKLGELWKGRKVLYFVATNHIKYFDEAVIRSQRFDALLFVAPPTYETKIEKLARLLRGFWPSVEVHFNVPKKDIERALESFAQEKTELSHDELLAVFVLLRWDELDELAYRLKAVIGNPKDNKVAVTRSQLIDALSRMSDARLKKPHTFHDYLDAAKYQRRDHSTTNVWELEHGSAKPPDVIKSNGRLWWKTKAELVGEISIPGYAVEQVRPGVLRFAKISTLPR